MLLLRQSQQLITVMVLGIAIYNSSRNFASANTIVESASQASTLETKETLPRRDIAPHGSRAGMRGWGLLIDSWYREVASERSTYAQYQRNPKQGLQPAIIDQIFQYIQPKHKYFVEFGFDTASWDGGGGANTLGLHHDHDWRGLLLDQHKENSEMNLYKHFITPTNIVSILESYRVPKDVDFISIDVDSSDAFVFYAILAGGYRPSVISVEYNCLYPLDATLANAGCKRSRPHSHTDTDTDTGTGASSMRDPGSTDSDSYNNNRRRRSGEIVVDPWRMGSADNANGNDDRKDFWSAAGSRVAGTGILPLKLVGDKFGYSIVAVDLGLDVFFVRNDLVIIPSSSSSFSVDDDGGDDGGTPESREANLYFHIYPWEHWRQYTTGAVEDSDASAVASVAHNILTKPSSGYYNPIAPPDLQAVDQDQPASKKSLELIQYRSKSVYVPKLAGAVSNSGCWCEGPRNRKRNHTQLLEDFVVNFELWMSLVEPYSPSSFLWSTHETAQNRNASSNNSENHSNNNSNHENNNDNSSGSANTLMEYEKADSSDVFSAFLSRSAEALARAGGEVVHGEVARLGIDLGRFCAHRNIAPPSLMEAALQTPRSPLLPPFGNESRTSAVTIREERRDPSLSVAHSTSTSGSSSRSSCGSVSKLQALSSSSSFNGAFTGGKSDVRIASSVHASAPAAMPGSVLGNRGRERGSGGGAAIHHTKTGGLRAGLGVGVGSVPSASAMHHHKQNLLHKRSVAAGSKNTKSFG